MPDPVIPRLCQRGRPSLCLAAALAEDMSVRVHLLDDGVEVGCHSHQVPEGAVNLEELLGELIECGLEVSACGMALNDCAIDASAMLPEIECGSMKALANWVKESDHVMVSSSREN